MATTASNIAALPSLLGMGKRVWFKDREIEPYTDGYIIRHPDGTEEKHENMESLLKSLRESVNLEEEDMSKHGEQEETNETFYGVEPDDWANDGDPVFDVDEDDYSRGVQRKPDKTWNFNDDRINQAVRNSKYKRLSFWLRKKDEPNRSYKFVRPKSNKNRKES